MNRDSSGQSDETPEHCTGRERERTTSSRPTNSEDISDDTLLSDWIAQSNAFGVLVFALSLLMASSMLIKRDPAAAERVICATAVTAASIVGDWQTWVVASTSLALAALVYLWLRSRR